MHYFRLATLFCCVIAISNIAADDRNHPFHPRFHRSVHASLSPSSPKWFRPGYGYQRPFQQPFRITPNPYLSRIADRQQPYAHIQLIDSTRDARDIFRQDRFNRRRNAAGVPWYLPGDVFRTRSPRHEFGQLR